MKKLIIVISIMALFAACHKDHTEDDKVKASRTVVVYISGENSLYDFIDEELDEMKVGSTTIGDNNLIIYVDRGMSQELPWLARVTNGQLVDSVSISDMNISPRDEVASDPKIMESVLRYAFNKYPAENDDYGLVLWGHASGWLINTDSVSYQAMARNRAYGIDNGKNTNSDQGKWMNIPSMAKMLSRLPHLTFIFADCCNFMCLESAYELRNVTDYIIGSPAEIPGVGAPYNTIVPAMFEKTSFWQSIVDRYYAQRAGGYDVPLSVIKTSEMEGLAGATRTVLKTFSDSFEGEYPNLDNLIYYYYDYSNRQEFYDANDFILRYASENNYKSWKLALDQAVIYKKTASRWMTNKYWGNYYSDFTITDVNFGGVSMFIPKYILQETDNKRIKDMAWYYAAGYSEIGW